MRDRLLRLLAAGVFASVLTLDFSQPAAQAPTASWTPELMMSVRRVPAVVPSPDGTQVAFVVGEAVTEGERSEWVNQIHVAAADGSASRQLTRGEKSSSDPHWSPDGKSLAFVSSRSGKANIWRIDPAGGEAEQITDEKGGVSAFEWSPDGASFAFVMRDAKTEVEEKADKEKRDWRTLDERVKMDRLYVVPLAKGTDGKRTARLLTPEPRSVNDFSWSPDGRTIVFDHQKAPGVDDWPSGDLALVTIADSKVTPLATSALAEDQAVYSPDGRFIAFTVSDDPLLRANPRGSSGYGQPFRFANRSDWGGGDYRDLMSGVDRVVEMGVADPARLGVMGWSYGGFMTSWVVTQTKRFKAASAGAAVTNLMSFTGVTDIPGFVPDYFKGEYWDTFDAWRTHSAMFNVKGVTTPTLIQHGEADDRVPISQGYEFYNALKRQGVTTRMTVYPRQPHGFVEPKMTLDAASANLAWFDRFVLGLAPSTSSP